MTGLELDDIQDILVGYPRFPHARYLFLRFGAAGKARDWVAGMAAHEVTTAGGRGDKSTSALNLALTWNGLATLGLAPETLATFPEEFRAGMSGRTTQLGDVDTNHPRHWEPGGPGTTPLHAVVIVHAATPEHLERRCRQVRDGLADAGEVVADQDGNRLQDGTVKAESGKQLSREHFGFLDGISQPIIEGVKGVSAARLPGQGVRQSDGTWRPLRAGEIVLGYQDEEGVQAASPTPPALGRNGTYLVYRKLGQDVAAFRRLIAEQGTHYPDGPQALAAKMMGRTPDGTPLALPDQHRTATGDSLGRAFTYADDLEGRKCPIGAHIRRANPRDGVEARDRLVHRHRILRRGISYGPPLRDCVLDDDGRQRGLLFVGLCASIARQFEFIQGQWLNDGNGLGLGDDQDPILSNSRRGTNLTIPGDRPHFLSPIPPLITMRGGEYFFLPGRRALAHLAHPSS